MTVKLLTISISVLKDQDQTKLLEIGLMKKRKFLRRRASNLILTITLARRKTKAIKMIQ